MRSGSLVAVLLLASVARADAGDFSIGPAVTVGWPQLEGRLGAVARLGACDWLSVDTRLALSFGDVPFAGVGSLGVVLAWDVLEWVPEARLAVGARVDEMDLDGRVIGEVGVRRFLSLEVAIAAGVAAEWTPQSWSGTVSLVLLFTL